MVDLDFILYYIYYLIGKINYFLKYPESINVIDFADDINIFDFITPDEEDVAYKYLFPENNETLPCTWLDDDHTWRSSSTQGCNTEELFLHHFEKQKDYTNPNVKIVSVIHTVHVPHYFFIKLSDSAIGSICNGNAGGNSILSEAYSIDLFRVYFNARDFIYETDISYWFLTASMVDYITVINGQRVGVSVTRAFNYMDQFNYTEAMAYKLLNKKLYGLLMARNAVNAEQRYIHSVLHVWVPNQHVAGVIQRVFDKIDIYKLGMDVYGNVIVYISICNNRTIYDNQPGLFNYLIRYNQVYQ